MAHNTEIVEGSVKRHPLSHGVSFLVRCCGEHEVSVHIQNVHRFSPEELARVREDYMAEAADTHEKILAAERLLASFEGSPVEDCGCK